MAREYVVKSLSVSGLGNKIYRAGDKVKDTDFPVGHAEKYLKEGHLAETGAKESVEKNTSDSGKKEAGQKSKSK